jgi:hypothetical protein
MAAKPDPEREWKKSLDAHAAHTMHGVITHCADLIANSRPGPLLGGLPTVEIQGPDGEWRRYYVRLTEAARHAPLDPRHLGAMVP